MAAQWLAFPRCGDAARCNAELAHLARDGMQAVQLYCVNLSGIDAVRRLWKSTPVMRRRYVKDQAAGVEVLTAYGSRHQEIYVERRLKRCCWATEIDPQSLFVFATGQGSGDRWPTQGPAMHSPFNRFLRHGWRIGSELALSSRKRSGCHSVGFTMGAAR